MRRYIILLLVLNGLSSAISFLLRGAQVARVLRRIWRSGACGSQLAAEQDTLDNRREIARPDRASASRPHADAYDRPSRRPQRGDHQPRACRPRTVQPEGSIRSSQPRYQRAAPGEMPHLDTKKLGRIERPSRRVTGDRRDVSRGAGWKVAHCRHRRPFAGGLRADARRREEDHGRCLLEGCRCPLRCPRHAHPAGADRQRQRLPLQALCARRWVSSTALLDPTAHKSMARPSASSRLACGNGPTPEASANSAERTSWLPAFLA